MTNSDTWNPNAHEFEEDVDDASMCVCGIPDLTHDAVMAQFAAPAGLPLHESADRDADNVPSDRVRAYAEAVDDAVPRNRVKRVMAVADAEMAEKDREIEELTLGLDVNEQSYQDTFDRAKLAEATIARVEALPDAWESLAEEHDRRGREAFETGDVSTSIANAAMVSPYRGAARDLRAALRGPEHTEDGA